MARNVTVVGLPELKKALTQKAAALQAGAAEAVAEEVKLVEADAKSGAPVKTGDLRAGIVSESHGPTGTVRATSRHSKFVEFGTYKDPTQPYMAPAASKSRRRSPKTFAAIIRKALGGT